MQETTQDSIQTEANAQSEVIADSSLEIEQVQGTQDTADSTQSTEVELPQEPQPETQSPQKPETIFPNEPLAPLPPQIPQVDTPLDKESNAKLEAFLQELHIAIETNESVLSNTHFSLQGIAQLLEVSKDIWEFYSYQCANLKLNNEQFNLLKESFNTIGVYISNTLKELYTIHNTSLNIFKSTEALLDEAKNGIDSISGDVEIAKETLNQIQNLEQKLESIKTINATLTATIAQAEAMKNQINALVPNILNEVKAELLREKESHELELEQKKAEFLTIFSEKITLFEQKATTFDEDFVIESVKSAKDNAIEAMNEVKTQAQNAIENAKTELEAQKQAHSKSLSDLQVQIQDNFNQMAENMKQELIADLTTIVNEIKQNFTNNDTSTKPQEQESETTPPEVESPQNQENQSIESQGEQGGGMQGENSQTQGGGDVVAMPTPIIPETESYPYIPNNTRIDDREFLEKDSKEIINNAIEFAEKWEKFMRENPDFLYEREMTFNDFYLANKNKHLAESYEEFLPNRLKGSRSIKEVMQPFYYSQESWVSNQLHDFDGGPPPTTFHKYGDLADMTYTQLEEVANLLGSGRQIEYREWADKCDTISRYGITAGEYGAELYASQVTEYKGFIDSFVSFFNANPTQRLFSNRTFRDYYTRMNTEGVLSYEDWISNEINNNPIMHLMTNFYKRDDLTLKKFFALMPRPKINDNNPLLYQSKQFLYSSLEFSSTDSAESSNAESSLNIESSTTDTNESWGGGNTISVSQIKKPNDFLGSLAVSPVFS